GGVDGKVRLRLLVGQARRLVGGGARILVLPCDARLQAASAAAVQGAAVLALEPCNTQIWRRFPDVWPVSVSPPAEARVLVDYVRQQGHERVAIVGDGRAARAVRAAAAERGLERVPASRADAVVVALAAPFAPNAVSRLRRRGIRAPVVATHGLDDRRAVVAHRAALTGSVFLTFGFPDPGSELDELFERYRALTGHPPSSSVAALGYDAVRVLEEAMVEAGSTEPGVLAATMPGLEAYGATGTIAYPDGGGRDPSVDVALVRIENGGLALIDRVKAS
ncbi:MAG: ABC transporter substrate-binding protein, partial [Actinomycetota bacterium]|nr:ABC transporter substrate-binding protein [Actinomycetota bacterium]